MKSLHTAAVRKENIHTCFTRIETYTRMEKMKKTDKKINTKVLQRENETSKYQMQLLKIVFNIHHVLNCKNNQMSAISQ